MSTNSDIVPYASHYVYETNDPREDPPRLGFKRVAAIHLCENEDEPAKYQGWSYDGRYDEIGKRQRIYAYAWTKDNHKVWVVNESEYAAVGDYNIALVADNTASITEFANDWEFKLPFGIDEDDTIQQTL